MWGLGRKKPQTQDKTTTWLFRHLLTWLDSFLVAEVNFLVFLSWKCLYSMLNINNRQSYFYILKANIIISKLSLAGNIYIPKSIRYSARKYFLVYTVCSVELQIDLFIVFFKGKTGYIWPNGFWYLVLSWKFGASKNVLTEQYWHGVMENWWPGCD